MQPRDALRFVRRDGHDSITDIAVIIDVGEVTLWDDKYMLHGIQASGIANPALGSRTPGQHRPVTSPNTIVVELDEDTFFALLNVPTPKEQAAMRAAEGDGIFVERDRQGNFTRPTLGQLRSLFRNRRIVVRGEPRLEVAFVGARRDFRQKKLFLTVDNSDDLAFLPRYDRNGNPIFDGPLETLREDYLPDAG
jgi:hypothetical protein